MSLRAKLRLLGVAYLSALQSGGVPICEMIGRMDYAYRLQEEAYFLGPYEPMLIHHPPSHYLKMMYLESTCYHPPAARCALDTVGVDHFIFGTDLPPPFVLKREGVDFINKIGLTDDEKDKVYASLSGGSASVPESRRAHLLPPWQNRGTPNAASTTSSLRRTCSNTP